jgi:protein-disulfide isomerase
VRGSSAAEVSIVEFSDFHCPYCRQAQATIDQLLQRYKGVVRVVYKHSPIDNLHPEARKAAEAAECAADQDQFWQFHDELFRMTPAESTGVDNLMSIAARLHLRAPEFQQCLQSGKHTTQVQRDVDEAAALGVTGTPTFFVNGRLMVGAQPLDSFANIIDEELAARGYSKLRTE